ncbi:MAG: hypothetical protein HC873_22735 [Leptolyngbyaceae cyanobacterium SL_1_1]|nr:hypothetical protein [Leptolyngbyaceae cyanobacterium RM1_1_2]NJO11972.1 hypothetical protein [Leptolyngbyaceae cyanobacterium SL_1_1]
MSAGQSDRKISASLRHIEVYCISPREVAFIRRVGIAHILLNQKIQNERFGFPGYSLAQI